jgi:hypothetical protein
MAFQQTTARAHSTIAGTRALAARGLFSRIVEVFAGFLMHAGHQAGRLIEFLPQFGELNTT